MDESNAVRARLSDWLGLIRFSHTIFALPFAALATAMAFSAPLPTGGHPVFRLRDLAGILLCMVFARSAAMAFNRVVDAEIDAGNPRTAKRHIPAGILSRRAVWIFTLACSLAFVGATALFLPNLVPLLASVPVLLFLCGYSLAKRFTSAAHVWLGVALSLSPICAWVAIRGSISLMDPSDLLPPLLLAASVAAWVTGFDIIYACQDAEYDQGAGLNSIPAKFGVAGAAPDFSLLSRPDVISACLSATVRKCCRFWLAFLECFGCDCRIGGSAAFPCETGGFRTGESGIF